MRPRHQLAQRRDAAGLQHGVEVLHQEGDRRQPEVLVHQPPVEPPHHLVALGRPGEGGEVRGDQRRVAPVQQPGGHAVVLRRHQQLPLVARLRAQEGPGVADEVAQDVLLQVRLGVRRARAAQPVQAGEQRPLRRPRAAVHRGVADPPAHRVVLPRRHQVEQLAQAVDALLLDPLESARRHRSIR
jgi:hypothetical protein